jgi:hypothetical protein
VVDPVTGTTAVALGWAGRKVIGPVLDRIGVDLANRYSDYRAQNALRICQTAEHKLGEDASEEGQVPPRVVKAVLDEGSWSDAEVMAEYFGGILAASRTPDGSNDRGASLAGLVSRLSTHDVYLHYLIYEAFRRIYIGRADVMLGRSSDRSTSRIYLRGHSVLSAMGLPPTPHNWLQFVLPSASMLLRESLIGEGDFIIGDGAFLRHKGVPYAPDEGLMVTPSLAGLQLFLWAHGHRQPDMNLLTDPGTDFHPVTDLGSVADAQEVAAMQPPPTSPAS